MKYCLFVNRRPTLVSIQRWHVQRQLVSTRVGCVSLTWLFSLEIRIVKRNSVGQFQRHNLKEITSYVQASLFCITIGACQPLCKSPYRHLSKVAGNLQLSLSQSQQFFWITITCWQWTYHEEVKRYDWIICTKSRKCMHRTWLWWALPNLWCWRPQWCAMLVGDYKFQKHWQLRFKYTKQTVPSWPSE